MNAGTSTSIEKAWTETVFICRYIPKFIPPALVSLVVLASAPSMAQPDPRCRKHGISLTIQGANTVLEHAANKVNRESLPTLRRFIPSAPPFDLNRLEALVALSYDHQFNDYLVLRTYAGVSYAAKSQVYLTAGDGYLQAIPIGQMDVSIKTEGWLYLAGTDLLFQTGPCDTLFHLVGGLGLAVAGMNGNLEADFGLIDSPLLTLSGDYKGFIAYANVLAGIRLDFDEHVYVMMLGGYRAGLGYISVHSDIEDDDGPLPVYGPFGQFTLGYRF